MKKFDINGTEVEVRKHQWSKRMSLKLQAGKVIVTIPDFIPFAAGKMFAMQNSNWIQQQTTKAISWMPASANYKTDKEKARDLVDAKLDYWNQYYQLDFNQVAIRDQSTRWGSASSQKNLNFSWRILYLPENLQDYIIVHEICHLKQPNHSPDFWKLVSQTISDYKQRRKDLKNYSLS